MTTTLAKGPTIGRVIADLRNERSARESLPPGELTFSLKRSHRFQRDTLQTLLAWREHYGPVFSFRLLHRPIVGMIGPEANHFVTVTGAENFSCPSARRELSLSEPRAPVRPPRAPKVGDDSSSDNRLLRDSPGTPMRNVRGNISSLLDRVYDRARHPDASDELEFATSAAGHLDSLKAYRYCLVITYRRSGEMVPTPVWFGVDENRLLFRTSAQAGKVKRIRANGRAAVAPCTARGHPLGPAVAYTARVLDGNQVKPAEAAIQAEYGIGRRLYTRLFGRADDDTAYVELSPPTTTDETPPVPALAQIP